MNENQFIFIFGKSKYHSLYNKYYYPISFNNFQKFSSKIILNPIKKETNSIMNFQYNSKLIKNNSVKNILKPIDKENLLINNFNKSINENKIKKNNNNNISFNIEQNKNHKIFDEIENNLNLVKLKILKKNKINKINNNINNESKTGSTRTTDYENFSFILKNKNNNNNNMINKNIYTNKKDLNINNKIHNKEIKFINLPKIKTNKNYNYSKMFSLINKYNKLKFGSININDSFNDIKYF